MSAAQDGDSGTYEQLLREILPFLRAIASQRVRDAAEAEDVVQDVLLTLHRVRATYHPARPFTAWMVAIAEQRSLDRLPRRARWPGRKMPTGAASNVAGRSAKEILAALVRQELHAATSGMTGSQATAPRLAELEELPLAEASPRSRLVVSALKGAMHWALLTLRKRFGAKEGPTST
nr:sigma factor [Plastoroseomonas hellenica]